MKKFFCLFVITLLISLLFSCVKTNTDPKSSVQQTTNPIETSEHTHSFLEATCTSPKTCSICSETEGDALGHNWSEATCDTPKTCSVCAATEGDALGHSWSEATCDTPKTCSVCAATEGDALGHSWSEATCDTPKTCSVCTATEGDALGHKISPKTSRCIACGFFEYNPIYATLGAIDMANDWLDESVTSYHLINAYYVYVDTCRCFPCLNNQDIGDPYVVVITYYEYTYEGNTYRLVQLLNVHKKYNAETDTYYMLTFDDSLFTYYYDNDEIIRIIADDNSFAYQTEDIIKVPVSDFLGE